MAARERVAALKRARERQRRIEEQTARTVRAYAAAERARLARQRLIERADQRVAEAIELATTETARLAATCGSSEAAAEILGLEAREVRRAVSGTARSDE
jgi:hypothetical protein